MTHFDSHDQDQFVVDSHELLRALLRQADPVCLADEVPGNGLEPAPPGEPAASD
jgi:hypothetical protein